jgi:transketolase
MDWPLEPFYVPEDVLDRVRSVTSKAAAQRQEWDGRFAEYAKAHPELAEEFQTVMKGELPKGTFDGLPEFEVGSKIATRKSGAKVLAALAKAHPTLMGGSADLTGSNGVGMPEAGNAQPQTPEGRAVHFGVREHGMAAICNGMAAHGGVRPFDATFLIFSDFMRGAVRLSALMKLPVVHVLSHDSIFLGEDGPTHQPVEQCMALRAIPNLHVVRPADAKETVAAWKHALQRKQGDGPTAILVTRQGLPTLEGTRTDISEGGYVLWEPDGATIEDLHGILIATGSEVPLVLEAAQRLSAQGKKVRVVSMPCWEAFEAQGHEHRDAVLPPQVTRRLSVEAGTTLGWDRYARHHHGIDTFGESGPADALAEHFGFTVEAVVAKYLDLV